MPKYKVVCIDKDGTYHEANYNDSEDVRIFIGLLKRLLFLNTTNMHSLTIYEDEKVIMHEDF